MGACLGLVDAAGIAASLGYPAVRCRSLKKTYMSSGSSDALGEDVALAVYERLESERRKRASHVQHNIHSFRNGGSQRIMERCFCDAGTTAALARIRRDVFVHGHSSYIGARYHACVEHNCVCSVFGNSDEQDAPWCEACGHPRSCMLGCCTDLADVVGAFLCERRWIPISVEFPVYLDRIGMQTRIDMLCANADDMASAQAFERTRFAVVSLKTKSLGEYVDAGRLTEANDLDVPIAVSENMKALERVDDERKRHQLQLMLECVALKDNIPDMHIAHAEVVYASPSPSIGTVDTPTKLLHVEDCAASSWWFETLMRGSEREANVDDLVAFMVQKLNAAGSR